MLITIVPFVLFGFGLGFILALVVIHYFCASDGSLNIQKASVKAIRRKGRQIKFTGKHPESGKTKKTVFKVDTEANAESLERELTSN